MATPTAYLKLENKGEGPLLGSSTTPGWLNWSELQQVKTEIKQPSDPNTVTSRRRERPAVEVLKEVDGLSQRLRQNLAKNAPFDSMTIDFVRNLADGKTLQKYARLECTGVYVAYVGIIKPLDQTPLDRSSSFPATAERITFRCATMTLTQTSGAPPNRDSWRE